jgi:hypothetical protein
MPYTKCSDDLKIAQGPACMHLRSKGMYVSGKLNPTHQEDGMGDGYCWCNQTQKVVGPDNEMVERALCVEGRECYQRIV